MLVKHQLLIALFLNSQNVFTNLEFLAFSKLFFRFGMYFGHPECVKEFLPC